jgi:uncharacterized ion transporter superfamily protein YfcC
MRKSLKAVFLVVMSLLEIVFLSWVFASNLPRRSADIEAFSRYQAEPTEENEKLWQQERQKTLHEVRLRKSVGACLAVGNVLLMVWVARRRGKPAIADGVPGTSVASQ